MKLSLVKDNKLKKNLFKIKSIHDINKGYFQLKKEKEKNTDI